MSTRGGVGYKTFEEALFSGYAEDGGFFVPEHIPKVDTNTLQKWKHLSYSEIVREVITQFVAEEEIPPETLRKLLANAHSRFDVEEVVKISSFGDLNIAELWHGPTMAFKDLAMLCVGEFYHYFLSKQKKHVTVIVGTSGDTGSSAIEAVRGKESIDLIVIYPHKRITKIQELMTTTILDDNIHVYATEGSLDDAEGAAKDIFADAEYAKKHNLCSFNSINWARVMVQIAHHVYIYLRTADAVGDPIDVVVPSGGCGNVVAGVYAAEMGVPINFVCAVNENDIIHRALRYNDFKMAPEIKATLSSSIDQQMPYNIERMLWIYSGGDAELCKAVMEPFYQFGETRFPQDILQKLSNIRTIAATDEIVLGALKTCYDQTGYIACPHTAIALSYFYGSSLHGSRQKSGTRRKDGELVPIVVVATASIHKFPESLKRAGIDQYEAPRRITELFHKKTRVCVMKKEEEWEKMLRVKIETFSEKACY